MSTENSAGEIKTVAGAVAAWKAGRPVETVAMGSVGPEHEHAIQVAIFGLLEALDGRDLPISVSDLNDLFQAELSNLPTAQNLSRAQATAAKDAAFHMLRDGYRETVQGIPFRRRIVTCRRFPEG
jgi:hypothetical protein